MIPPIGRQLIRNWSYHHCINHNSMMTRRNPGRNTSRTAHKNSNERLTMRNYSIFCFRSFILCINLLNILPLNLRVVNNMQIGTRHVISAKHWMWLPDDDFMLTETCWSSFYNFNYFNNLRIL